MLPVLTHSLTAWKVQLQKLLGFIGLKQRGKNSEEVPVGTNHESVHIIRVA